MGSNISNEGQAGEYINTKSEGWPKLAPPSVLFLSNIAPLSDQTTYTLLSVTLIVSTNLWIVRNVTITLISSLTFTDMDLSASLSTSSSEELTQPQLQQQQQISNNNSTIAAAAAVVGQQSFP
jgi:hypothetical protein